MAVSGCVGRRRRTLSLGNSAVDRFGNDFFSFIPTACLLGKPGSSMLAALAGASWCGLDRFGFDGRNFVARQHAGDEKNETVQINHDWMKNFFFIDIIVYNNYYWTYNKTNKYKKINTMCLYNNCYMFKLRKSYNPTCNTVTNMMCGYRTYKTLLLLLLYWSYCRIVVSFLDECNFCLRKKKCFNCCRCSSSTTQEKIIYV